METATSKHALKDVCFAIEKHSELGNPARTALCAIPYQDNVPRDRIRFFVGESTASGLRQIRTVIVEFDEKY